MTKLYFIGDVGLCPVCGEPVALTGATTEGRLIASCNDAFWPKQWDEERTSSAESYRKRRPIQLLRKTPIV